tara:strand:- start:1962 stop:2141 length:180 start_codon:yes stop_codon:yes gene_type:complete
MVRKIPFNLIWDKRLKPDEEGVLFKAEVNVSQSGFISPGSYDVEVKGNVIYWPINKRGE